MLSNKVVIIAGGCGRIGKSFVEAIIENKGICIIADIDVNSGKNIVNLYKSKSPNHSIDFFKLDISNKLSILEIIDSTVKKYKKIDAFVNASYPRNKNWGKKFEDVTFEDICENINIHLGGYFIAAQQLCIFFKKQGFGNLVNISSIMGVGVPKFDTYEQTIYNGKEMTSPAEYSIIKAGIIHFTRYIAKYYSGCNIRCNCISPGGILADQPKKFIEKYRKYCLSKGLLDPEDLKGTLVYLLSDASQYLNGQNLIVDDGWSL